MRFTVASFNVNGIRARLELLIWWLESNRPHVVALQETKVPDEEFPLEQIHRIGYQCAYSGQKGFNGVAVLSLFELGVLKVGFEDSGPQDKARLILVETLGLKVLNTYVPQGTSVESERFQYKIQWFSRLRRFMEENLSPNDPALWLGDFNVAPEPEDVFDPVGLEGQVGFHPEERKALHEVKTWGWVDVFRLHVKEAGHYTFWDYRIPRALSRGMGWRVDHIWATPPLAQASIRSWIETSLRASPRPSDHAPVMAEFRWPNP